MDGWSKACRNGEGLIKQSLKEREGKGSCQEDAAVGAAQQVNACMYSEWL